MFETNPFFVGAPVTVSTDKHITRGHAVYGMVRSVTEQLAKSKWPRIMTDILVEVHSIPDYEVDWRQALLWKEPPSYTIHIQPHAFLHPNYVPLPLDAPEVANVDFSLESVNSNSWEYLARPKPVARLPTIEEYPPPLVRPPVSSSTTFLPHPHEDRIATIAAETVIQRKRSYAEIAENGEVSSSTSIPIRFSLKRQFRDNRPSPTPQRRSKAKSSDPPS